MPLHTLHSILRAETQQVTTGERSCEGRVRSKLSLVRSIQSATVSGQVGDLVRYWTKNNEDEGDSSTTDDDNVDDIDD